MGIPMNLIVPMVASGLVSAALAVAVTVQVVTPAPAPVPAPVTAAPPQPVVCPDVRPSRDEEQWRQDMLRGGIPPATRYRHVPAP